MLRDSFNFFKDAVFMNHRAHTLFETNRDFCISKGITIADIKKDMSEFYLYPNQNKLSHSKCRVKYVVGESGQFEAFSHPDDNISSFDKNISLGV